MCFCKAVKIVQVCTFREAPVSEQEYSILIACLADMITSFLLEALYYVKLCQS